MFIILPDDTDHTPNECESAPTGLGSVHAAGPWKAPAQRRPEGAPAAVDRLADASDAEGFDEVALDLIVDLILGGSPHSAKHVAGIPTCITCQVQWPCPPTVTLILSARGGTSAVEAAKAAYTGESADGAE